MDPDSIYPSGQSALESLGYFYCTFLPELIECVCTCVFVHLEWGLFRGFTAAPSGCVCQRRNLGMCSSNKWEGRQKKRERGGTGQWAFSDGLRMVSTRCGGIFILLTLKFLLHVRVCVYAEPQLSTTGLLDDSVQWGVHWSDSKWRREEKMV